MNELKIQKVKFIASDDGATAIEYGLIASGVSVVIAPAVWLLGDVVLTELFEKVATALESR
jgi:Flp pilus assembly pilin Flp